MQTMIVGSKVLVDYPQEGERVVSRQYTFRIAADGAERVLVSVDEGQWQPARKAAGYWWFDWQGYEPGVHQLEARAFRPGERPSTSETRRFFVEL